MASACSKLCTAVAWMCGPSGWSKNKSPSQRWLSCTIKWVSQRSWLSAGLYRTMTSPMTVSPRVLEKPLKRTPRQFRSVTTSDDPVIRSVDPVTTCFDDSAKGPFVTKAEHLATVVLLVSLFSLSVFHHGLKFEIVCTSACIVTQNSADCNFYTWFTPGVRTCEGSLHLQISGILCY